MVATSTRHWPKLYEANLNSSGLVTHQGTTCFEVVWVHDGLCSCEFPVPSMLFRKEHLDGRNSIMDGESTAGSTLGFSS